MGNQKQKSGDNSTNYQANNITIIQGPSVEEFRQIALDVFKANFLDLSQIASETVKRRVEELLEKFIKKLMEKFPEGIHQAQNPDFQQSLYTAQKEYALTGDEELGDLLVELLVDRSKQESRSILQIVLGEALKVASKLTKDQISALSVIFLLMLPPDFKSFNFDEFLEYLDKYIEPLIEFATPNATCYRHLAYSGCGNISVLPLHLTMCLKLNFGGLFSEGFDEDTISSEQISVPLSHEIFIRCINDDTRFQLNGINENAVKLKAEKLGISKLEFDKLLKIHDESTMSDKKIMTFIIDKRPYMKNLFDIWDNSDMKHFLLSTVGIAIAHANVKKFANELEDLSNWIN